MRRFLSSCLLLLLAVFTSCEKETVLTVDQTTLSFTAAGGSQTVSLTANKPWTASSNQSWCKVSLSGGEEAASSRITIACDANTSYDERSCTVTFTCSELTKTVSVTQATNNGLLVSQTSYELTKAAQQLNIEVKANVKFSVDVDASCKDWITYNTTKGLTTNTVVLDIAENKSYDNREGKVTIKQNGGNLSSTITIKQSQLDGLFISTPEYDLSNEKHTLTVEVSTNVDFDVTPGADWVKYVQTKGLSTKQIILEVAENDTYDQRETAVNVKQKNGSLSGTIMIKQDEKYGILVTQSEYNLSNEAQTIDVEVKYNVDFDVVIPSGCEDWIKQVSTKSLNSKTYSFSIAKNTTYDNRDGSITFKEKNGSISTTVSIGQAQTDYLAVSKKEYLVDVVGETIEIEVSSNVDYTVSVSEDAQSWLSRVDTKGLLKDQLFFAVSPGDSDTDRTGRIIMSYGELSQTVMVHQCSYEANTFIQFEDEILREKLVAAFDTNKDGELSILEARAVTSQDLRSVHFGEEKKRIDSFGEFQYFTGVDEIPDNMFAEWRLFGNFKWPNSIKKIGNKAFYKSGVGSIPSEGITEIGESAFSGCWGLHSIRIPGSVNSIGESAFSDCSNLESVDFLSESVSIADCMFKGCAELRSVKMPERATSIGDSAFWGCHKLNNVTLPDKVTRIGDYAFKYCWSLTSITLPDGLSYIGNSAFFLCRNITSISIPQSVTHIGEFAFRSCDSLIGNLTIPNGITSIETGVFHSCSKLTQITIPDSVTSIGDYAFAGCTSLTSINIPKGVTKIGQGAFASCVMMDHFTIPSGVTRIEDHTFNGCYGLTTFTIPEWVTSIGDNAFYACLNLASISIPESVKSIGRNAFGGCHILTSVNIPESIALIESGTFSDCKNLTYIEIPNSVTTIGDAAFGGCEKLTSIVIPDSVTSIGDRAFAGCSSLTSLTIPEGATIIVGERAFQHCSSLTSIKIPKGVTTIGNWAFYGCISLTSIEIPEGVTSIGDNAFDWCEKLPSIILPNSIVSIGGEVFRSCSKLASITILAVNPPYLGSSLDRIWTIYVPASSVDAYKAAERWRQYADKIQAIP